MPPPYLEIRGARELEANALEEAALGSETDSFVYPVISKNRPAVTFSFQEFSCEIVVLVDLESGCYEVGPIFVTLLMVLRWDMLEAVHVNIGCCLGLVHLASVSMRLPLSAHLPLFHQKNTLVTQ